MKKIFTLIALALGVIAIYSCEGDEPTPKPPVIVKPEPKPDPPKEPVLTITQAPEGIISWGQSAKVTITSENAKFFWNGDSVTTTTLELKYLLKDTTFSIEAKGYKTISKSHTIAVSTPTEYEKLIVGAWQMVAAKAHVPFDYDDRSKGYYWKDWSTFQSPECADIPHYAVDKRMRMEFPCLADDGGPFIVDGGINPYRYAIRTDSVGRPTLEPENIHQGRNPLLINYPEVIVKLTKDTLIILQEIKPGALATSNYLTHMRMYVLRDKKPYAFTEEEGGIAASRRKFVTAQQSPSYAYKKGVGIVRL